MLKTFVDVIISKQLPMWPEIIRNVIALDNGFEISAYIPRRKYVRIYFSYKWYQFIDMLMLKETVKDCEKRLRYYDTTNSFRNLLAGKERVSSEEFTKELTRFTNAGVQGNSESNND